MNAKNHIAISFLLFAFFYNGFCQVNNYLDQTLPGNTPKVFNLSASSGYFAAERIAFSKDSTQIYYSELNGYSSSSNARIKYYSYSDGTWNNAQTLFEGFSTPSLSADGNKMFFQKAGISSREVWYSIHTEGNWSTPARFMPNQPLQYMLWETTSGNYYCATTEAEGNVGNTDFSKLIINDKDTALVSFGNPVCTNKEDLDFFIAQDESFIIISRSNTSLGNLFICYAKSDGSWTNPKDLGFSGWAPVVTSDNKYLFYTGNWNLPEVYWVQIDNLIDSLRNTNFSPYVLNTIPDQTDSIGDFYNFTIPDSIFFDDDGNETLTLSATLSDGNKLPDWLSFDNLTNTISGELKEAGIFRIEITATDTAGASVSDIFNFTVIQTITAIHNLEDNTNLLVFPNPANQIIQIETDDLNNYQLINSNGVIVRQGNSSTKTISVSDLSKGIYILQIKTNNGFFCEKIIIQ